MTVDWNEIPKENYLKFLSLAFNHRLDKITQKICLAINHHFFPKTSEKGKEKVGLPGKITP